MLWNSQVQYANDKQWAGLMLGWEAGIVLTEAAECFVGSGWMSAPPQVTGSFWMFVQVCVTCVHVCTGCWGQKMISGVLVYHLLPYFLEIVSLTGPRVRLTGSKPYWASCSFPHKVLWLMMHEWPYMTFYVGPEDLNSGSYGWAAQTPMNWVISLA